MALKRLAYIGAGASNTARDGHTIPSLCSLLLLFCSRLKILSPCSLLTAV